LAKQEWKTGLLVLLSFHIHLFEEMRGSRGSNRYQWPIPYLILVFVPAELAPTVGAQARPNLLITLSLLLLTFWLAWWLEFSALELISAKADSTFVAALRRRFTGSQRV